MEKLIKIQLELKAPKNQRNKFGNYNYRSCEDILEAAKPLLVTNGCTLTISDEIKEVGSIIYVESTATFSDGQTTTSVCAQAGIDPNRKGMDISQSFGSSSSYARKYALNGLFLIDDTKEVDSLDNSHENKESNNNIIWLTEDNFNKVRVLASGQIQKCIDKYNGKEHFSDGKIYNMKKEYRTELEKLLQ